MTMGYTADPPPLTEHILTTGHLEDVGATHTQQAVPKRCPSPMASSSHCFTFSTNVTGCLPRCPWLCV